MEADRLISHVSNTLCPGTDAYMPPEAVDKNAVYTEKGDIFSFGVNIVQILTRKFPDPGDRFKTVYIDHPQFPSGRVEVRASEVERRNNHVSTIDIVHPLLPISLDCLKDKEGERPLAGELCQRLATLRNTPECTASERQSQENGMASSSIKDHQISELQEQLHLKQQQIQSSQQSVEDREHENQRLRQDVVNATSVISIKEQEIQRLEATLHDVLDTKQQRSHSTQENKETVTRLVQQSIQPEHPPVTSATPYSEPSNMMLSTKYGEKAPCTMSRYSDAVVNGSVAYFKLPRSELLLAFNVPTETWSRLPDCLADLTTLVVVKDYLTTVGGKGTNCLFSLIEDNWTEVFPPMPTERHNVTAVCTDTVLVVAGGEENGLIRAKTLKTVEVMNTETRQWSTAADLPGPLYKASATVCGGHLYMLGGWGNGLTTIKSVLSCSVSHLPTSPLLQ